MPLVSGMQPEDAIHNQGGSFHISQSYQNPSSGGAPSLGDHNL